LVACAHEVQECMAQYNALSPLAQAGPCTLHERVAPRMRVLTIPLCVFVCVCVCPPTACCARCAERAASFLHIPSTTRVGKHALDVITRCTKATTSFSCGVASLLVRIQKLCSLCSCRCFRWCEPHGDASLSPWCEWQADAAVGPKHNVDQQQLVTTQRAVVDDVQVVGDSDERSDCIVRMRGCFSSPQQRHSNTQPTCADSCTSERIMRICASGLTR
jgi:hypothetical protein